MWIEICSDVFEKGDFKSLNFLYQILSWFPTDSIKRYDVFVDYERVKKTNNYQKLKTYEVNFDLLLESSFNDFVTSSSSNKKKEFYITYKKAKNNFEIEEAIQFFSQPVSIVLENNKNDSVFIETIINCFGKKEGLNKAQEHLKNNWLRFENAGGCSNLPNFIEMFLQQFQKLALKNDRDLSDYFRGIIILDSDREYSSQLNKHDTLINKLNNFGINNSNIHVLQKRMMENYMPDEVFVELKNLFSSKPIQNDKFIKWINAYLHLEPNESGINERKDFLNIYKGKLEGEEKPVNEELKELYNIGTVNYDILDEGFKYKGKQFKNEFPLLFKTSTSVNKSTLSSRCGTDEYDIIMRKINQLL